MKQCPYCKAELENIAKECGACKKQLPEASTAKKTAIIILIICAFGAMANVLIKMFMAFE